MLYSRLETREANFNVFSLKEGRSNSKQLIWETERNEKPAWKKKMKIYQK